MRERWDVCKIVSCVYMRLFFGHCRSCVCVCVLGFDTMLPLSSLSSSRTICSQYWITTLLSICLIPSWFCACEPARLCSVCLRTFIQYIVYNNNDSHKWCCDGMGFSVSSDSIHNYTDWISISIEFCALSRSRIHSGKINEVCFVQAN